MTSSSALLSCARYERAAVIEDIDYRSRAGLDRAQLASLASCDWIRLNQNLLIHGATGSGKTYLACALAQQACRAGLSAWYVRAPRLFEELNLCHADGSFRKRLAAIARFNVLVIDDFALLEKVTLGGVTSFKHHIIGGSGPVALHTRRDNGTQSTFYFTTDHLGSVDSITDAAGAVQARLSYHAFGKRRKDAGWSGNLSAAEYQALSNTSWRGFTFHEMLDSVGMIHMNGRVYSPTLGRFLSPDPFVPDPLSTQSFNRYSYVQNHPLSATDPSGFEDRIVNPRYEGVDPQVFQERLRDITQQNYHRMLFFAEAGFGGGRFGGFIGVTGPVNLFNPASSWRVESCGGRGDCMSTATVRPVVTAPRLEQIGTTKSR